MSFLQDMIGKYAFANVQQLRSHLVGQHLFSHIKHKFCLGLRETEKLKCPTCRVPFAAYYNLLEHFGDNHCASRNNVGQMMEMKRKLSCPDCDYVAAQNMDDMLKHCLVKHYHR